MNYDYDSFLAGLITGLKLGRYPGNITPPSPPSPSDTTIITEAEVVMITESGDILITE